MMTLTQAGLQLRQVRDLTQCFADADDRNQEESLKCFKAFRAVCAEALIAPLPRWAATS
jgi:hypothetical protein